MVQHAAAAAGGAAAAAGSKKVADSLEKILGGAAISAATAAQTTPAVPAVSAPTAGKRGKRSPFEPQVTRAGGSEMAPVVTFTTSRQGAISLPAEVEATTSGESVPGNPWVSRRSHPQHTPVPAFTPFVTNDAPAASRGLRRSAGNAPLISETAIASPGSLETIPAALVSTPVVLPPRPRVVATLEKLSAIQQGASYETILAELGTPASKIEMIEDGKVLESLRIEANGSKIGTILMVNGVVTSVEPVAR